MRDLEVRSGRRGPAVVSGVSFAVRPGEVLGLVGESGSGKTTVALALLGHTRRGLSVTGGEIRLDGTDLLRLRPGELRRLRGARVSYVPQDPAAALNPALRVGYQLREALRVHGVAAVYVSHDLAVVSELVAEVAVMYAGRIVEAGPAPLLFPRPLHPYTRGLLASVPTPDGAERLAGIPGQPPAPGQRGPGCTFAPRCALAVAECREHEPEPAVLAGRVVRCWRVAETAAGQPERPRPPAIAAAPPGAAALSLRGVSASYGPVPVLSAIDLDVPGGACVAIVGESGSGKTTLARCIVGLHRNWTGEITLHGMPLAHRARDRPKLVLKQIQCVFQNPYTSLNPRKTVGQIVAEPLQRFLGLSRDEQAGRVIGALEDVSLGSAFLARYPDQLSGGERQRVAIARALVVEPDLLVCDEVTSALDVSVQAVIVELLRAVAARRHLAMIFITHNLALVRSVAQSAVVLRQGQIVEAGPARQVLARPSSEYTARLMADVPRLARPEASL